MNLNAQKLDVWNQSMQLVKLVYQVTKLLPEEEKYTLVSQQRRAAVSILSNIAEGNARYSPKERARFFEIAFGSLVELKTQMLVSIELGYVSPNESKSIEEQMTRVSQMLSGLRKSQLKRK